MQLLSSQAHFLVPKQVSCQVCITEDQSNGDRDERRKSPRFQGPARREETSTTKCINLLLRLSTILISYHSSPSSNLTLQSYFIQSPQWHATAQPTPQQATAFPPLALPNTPSSHTSFASFNSSPPLFLLYSSPSASPRSSVSSAAHLAPMAQLKASLPLPFSTHSSR